MSIFFVNIKKQIKWATQFSLANLKGLLELSALRDCELLKHFTNEKFFFFVEREKDKFLNQVLVEEAFN